MNARHWIVIAAAIGAAWLVLRTAIVSVTATGAPKVALAVAPNDPVALITASNYRSRSPKSLTPAQVSLLDRAVQVDPLYPEPYLARAALASARGEESRAIRLAELARSRDPRDEAVHLFLLQRYTQAGRIEAAVAEMNPIVALAGQAAPSLANALGVLAQSPQGQRVIAAALRTNPTWRSAFIERAGPASEGLAFETLLAAPAGVGETDRRRDQRSFIDRMMQRRDYQRAYLAWVNFLPQGGSSKVDAIYDGSFAGLPGLEPFNWTLIGSEIATAERRSDSTLPGRTALDVNYFGAESATIANQTLFIQPGSYLFQLAGTADGGGQFAGRLRWQLTCLPGGVNIPLATIGRFDGRPFTIKHLATIPQQGCEAQQISLVGVPGDVATLIHAQFTGLRLTPHANKP